MTKPTVGSIVVSKSGDCLVHVWPDEGGSVRTFTGVSLFSGDCSSLWRVDAFEHASLFRRELLAEYRRQRKSDSVST